MENQKAKIEFYRQRSFSEKLNATFDFVRENFKPLLKYSFYFIMPICLVQAYVINQVMDFATMLQDAQLSVTVFYNYGVAVLCSLLGSAVISGLVYAMMQTYAIREERLKGVRYDDFRESLFRNIGRCLLVSLTIVAAFAFVLIAFILILATATPLPTSITVAVTILLVIVLLLLMLPLLILVPVYVFERDVTFGQAIQKAWKLGTETLGGMLGLVIVLSVLSSVISSVATMPWYITWLARTILTAIPSDSVAEQSVFFKFALYILGLIQAYGNYASSIIGAVGLAFHYFHAREKIEGVRIESNISNFNSL